MALTFRDRCKNTSTTTGTGTYTLGSAVAGFQSIGSIGNSAKAPYCATDGTDWEIGVGTYATAGTLLARTTILKSSNGDAAVNWSAGTRTLFLTMPADRDVVGTVNQITVTESDTTTDLTLSLDATLAAMAALTTAADKLIYATGADAFATTDLSSFVRTILDDTNAAGVRTTIGAGTGDGDMLAANNLSDVDSAGTSRTNLGVGTGDSPQFTAVNLGHASDTSISRVSAGLIAVEGVTVVDVSATQTLTNKTITAPVINDSTLSGSNQVTGRSYAGLYALTDGATITVDWSTGNTFTVTLGGNRTVAFSNTVAGQLIKIRFLQDGTGSRTITWPGVLMWAGGTAPTLTTTVNKADWIGFICKTAGSTYDAFVLSKNH